MLKKCLKDGAHIVVTLMLGLALGMGVDASAVAASGQDLVALPDFTPIVKQ